MRNLANDFFTQIKGIWTRLDAGQRFVVTAVTLATIAGLAAIVWFAGRPSYQTVFTAQTADDIQQARSALQKEGIAYEIGPNRALQVDSSKVNAAQMALAAAGLNGTTGPSVGGGLSLIEDAETKAWKLDAASRQAVASAIQQLEGVQQVTVTASRPRRQAAFRDRDEEMKPSATVVLRLRQGYSFESIARAASSLASSQLMVPQKNIEVVSSAGNQRFRYDPDREAGGGTSEFLALQRSMGDERTHLAQERLDQLWPGKISVAVAVELDSAWEIRSEKVLPTEAIVRSEKTKKDETKPNTGKDGDTSSGSSKNETKDREFVTEIGERKSGKMMPDVKRMTVAVLYDRSLESTAGFKDDLINTVKAIVGWDPARDKPEAFSTMVGDFVPVAAELDTATGPSLGELALRWGPTVGQVLGVFVVVMFLRGLFKRSMPVQAPGAPALSSITKDEVLEENLPPEEQQKRMRREIERSIASDPAALAKLLETWLVEQKA
jgi:flagellar M-ring protein FliF